MESHGYYEPILILILFSVFFLANFAPVSLAVCLPKNPSFPPFGAPPIPAIPPQITAPSGPSPIKFDYSSFEDSSFDDDSSLSSPAYAPKMDSSFPDYIIESPEYAPVDSTFPDYLSSPDEYAPASDNSPLSSPASDLDFELYPDSAPSKNVDPALEKICKSTDYYDICVQAISPLLNGKTDVISIFKLAVKAAADNTNLAIGLAVQLAQNKHNSEELSSMIGDCKDSYTDSLENFDEALSSLPEKDVGTMNSMLSASITDFSDCDDFLKGYDYPLLGFNRKLIKLTSNCLAIASLIN